ncbi:MAG: hypothetical protein HY074_11450 [Deltaproteobacteria bacterium]|nr:hypothetical protein [Deltaproteobacteria bacterium]
MTAKHAVLHKLNLFMLSALAVALLTAQGCGKDSVSDAVTRQKTRERAVTVQQLKDSQAIGGDYVGVGSVTDGPTYDMTAFIATALANKDGMIVPQATVTGSFATYNRSKLNAKGKAVKTVFPFSNGSYDSGLKKLVVTILGNQGAQSILINCDVPDTTRMNCLWHSFTSDLHFNFTLIKQ